MDIEAAAAEAEGGRRRALRSAWTLERVSGCVMGDTPITDSG
jgi:hypothetical protein